MIRCIFVWVFIAFGGASVLAQPQKDGRVQLCFQRPENNGAMNTLESWIRIGDYDVPVIGGQEICLFLDPGKNDLLVTSLIPYEPHAKDEEACKSKPIALDLRANSKRTFLICPATHENSYACGWSVTQIKPQFNSGCGDQ